MFDCRKISGSITRSDPALILSKYHIHDPVQVIFDLPVIADKRRHLFRLSFERSDVELLDSFDIALNFTFGLDHYYGFQPWPVVAFFEPSRVRTYRVTACLNAAVARISVLDLFYKAFPLYHVRCVHQKRVRHPHANVPDYL